jgi:hypothetical protein
MGPSYRSRYPRQCQDVGLVLGLALMEDDDYVDGILLRR